MKRLNSFILIFLLATISQFVSYVYCQSPVGPEKGTIISPVAIPVFLAGNFGEPRANHFHSGIDIKTNGVAGIPVMAVADGTVSRIKVEPGGYGHALYIIHKNGYTSVYGHLSSFSQEIEEYVKNEQYRRESFSVELFPEASRFPVKKGQMVALSGNSGSSEGPHLHFELRESSSGNTINPLVRAIQIEDNIKPVIGKVYAFSLSGRQEWIKPVSVPLSLSGGVYKPAKGVVIPLDKVSGFGIETWDLADGSPNKCGVYHIQASLDGEPFFEYVADEFAFAETRYMNSFMDYRLYLALRRPILKLYIDPNNHLSLYRFSRNRGRIEISDSNVHMVTLVIEDAAGNKTEAQIPVGLDPSRFKRDPDFIPLYNAYFTYNEINRFSSEGIDVTIPAGTLYDDLYFQYEADKPMTGSYSLTHRIHRSDLPLHQYYRLGIEPVGLPSTLRAKAIIAQYAGNGNFVASGGSWEGNRLVSRTRSFGTFCIRVDTIKPEIKPINFSNADDLRNASAIRLMIKDNFPGIQSYRAEVDGKWALMEYDPKNNLLEYKIDGARIGTGKQHTLVLEVSDQVNNIARYTVKFYR